MAEVYNFENARSALRIISAELIHRGKEAAPRGIETLEFMNVITTIQNPKDCLSLGINRKFNRKLAVAEALQLIGGFTDPAELMRIAPNTAQFRTGGVFPGAYGPRIRPQIQRAVDRLRKDSNTRQAVVTVWDPLHDQQDEIKDVPCTISMNWHIRDDKLHMTTHMRSNDIWWGWTYDVVQFTQLQCTVANALGCDVGQYVHVVDSMHMYTRDIAAIAAMTGDTVRPTLLGGIMGNTNDFDWPAVRKTAEAIFYDNLDSHVAYTDTELWMHEALHG